MSTRHVVVVAFPGVQPLDAVGPIEVFAGATRTARALGLDGAYRVTLASTDGQPSKPRAGSPCARLRSPTPTSRSTTLVIARRNGPAPLVTTRPLISWIQTVAPTLPAGTTVCTGNVRRRPGRPPRWPPGHHPLGQRRASGGRVPDLSVDPDPIYIKDGKYWTSAGSRPGSTWPSPWCRRTSASRCPRRSPAGWSCSCTDRAARRSSLRPYGCAGRALDRPGRAGTGRSRARR